MKRADLIRHLEANGCRLVREGSAHSIYADRSGRLMTAVPRHREVNHYTAKNICRDLQAPAPPKK